MLVVYTCEVILNKFKHVGNSQKVNLRHFEIILNKKIVSLTFDMLNT